MQDNPKINPEQFPDVERDDWSAEHISEEAANEPADRLKSRIVYRFHFLVLK